MNWQNPLRPNSFGGVLTHARARAACSFGRVVDIVSGDRGLLPIAVALAPGTPLMINCAREGDLGVELGAKAAVVVTRNTLLYGACDGRLRNGYEAHSINVGIKVRW
jgi:hypothetical protein